MRWLIALIAVMAAASGARAATQAEIVCPHYDAPWAAASASGSVAKMQALAGNIPSYCPLKGQALHHIAQLAQQRLLAEQHSRSKPAPAPDIGPTDADSGDADAGSPPSPLADLAPPAAPLIPCSPAEVEARFPQIPPLGADPANRPGSRAELASSYVQRARAFSTCGHQAQAVGDINDAMRLDPHSFTAAATAGDLALAAQEYDTAIADYTAAIAREAYVPQDQNPLDAYAGRAAAEAALQRYPEEIGDLQHVTQHFNDAAHDTLKPLSVYYEQLAKALYRSGQADAAANDLTDSVDASDKDAEDLQFLGQRRLAARDWAGAIALFQQALAKMPDDSAARPAKARLEVLLAQAYIGSGDKPEGLAHFRLAEDLDPTNADARAGHASVGDPPPPPTFEDPELRDITLPGGAASAADLATLEPGPFCNQVDKNHFLETVKAASADVNANITAIAGFSGRYLQQRAAYDADPRLDYNTKISDEAMFDKVLQKLNDESRALNEEGYALLQFFNRINGDASDFKVCKVPNSAAGG